MKKLKSSLLNMVVVLGAIAIVAGGVLAYVNEMTEEPIAKINAKNLSDGIKAVVGDPNAKLQTTDTLKTGEIVYKTDKGVAVAATTNGFGGNLQVLVGFDADGNIKGYKVLETHETPGLGVKAAAWFQKDGKGNIIGKNPGQKELTVSKDGGEVDAITASTITSRAFLLAVNNAYKAYMGEGTSGASKQANKPLAVVSKNASTDGNTGASEQEKSKKGQDVKSKDNGKTDGNTGASEQEKSKKKDKNVKLKDNGKTDGDTGASKQEKSKKDEDVKSKDKEKTDGNTGASKQKKDKKEKKNKDKKNKKKHHHDDD